MLDQQKRQRKLTLPRSQRSKINMHNHRASPLRVLSHKNKPPARVHRHRNNRPHSHLLIAELVLSPVQPFISAEKDEIRWFLVVRHNQHRSRVAELPEMSILVDFLPREPTVSTEEGIAVCICCKGFADVADCHNQAWDGWAAESSSRVITLSVTMEVELTLLCVHVKQITRVIDE